ncbi:exocyst complex component SEC3A-like [Trifolium medium]|uniref:Exocyst complex component SEC3A-like n=1 Tax=Trifolium medium TaxID=97028 RepID=A0A392MSS5_9FABA|nr:exocyst complex component SEC3A-like [Trifolium medium]
MQSVNNKSLIEELDKLLEQLNIPPEYSAFLTGDSFDEAQMLQNEEACEWLIGALRGFQASNIDPTYVKMRAVCSLPYLLIWESCK